MQANKTFPQHLIVIISLFKLLSIANHSRTFTSIVNLAKIIVRGSALVASKKEVFLWDAGFILVVGCKLRYDCKNKDNET